MSFIDRIAAGLPGFLARRFASHPDPLLRGDRLAAAKDYWPEADWPTLYADIPDDIRRPVVWDGRLLGGADVVWLAWHHFSPELVTEVAARAGHAAKRASLILFALMVAYFAVQTGHLADQPYPHWAAEIGAIMPIIGYYAAASLGFVSQAVNIMVYAALAALLAFPAFWVFGFLRSLKGWFSQACEPSRAPSRDALMIHKHRADIRPAEYQAYCRQVADAIGRLAHLPLIPIGRALGTFRARGDMEAPSPGQIVALDGESICQSGIIMGPPGAGKTREIIRPLFDKALLANWGGDHRIGAYVTDGKGTLWRDLLHSVKHRSDVRVVGTGPDHYGVDLLAGMSPLEVATTFKAVSGQVAGKPADDFWPESASGRIMHAAAIARVLDLDEQSRAKWSGLRPYSLLGLARLATDDKAQEAACDRVRELAQAAPGEISADLYNAIPEAIESVEWLLGTWFPMAQETRSGIVANINVVVGKLGGAGILADRFFRGTCERTVDVTHALGGGVMMIAVGETEFGLAGKVVTVWLKTRLYVAARKRLVTDPEACRRTCCALIADEYQMLVTSGPDSDVTFWNVARETGVFMIAATQGIAALQQVIGTDQTNNILNLLRTKIVLRTEEIATIEYMRKLAGEIWRAWDTDPNFFPTQGVRQLAYPDVTPPTPHVGWRETLLPTMPRLTTAGMKEAVATDFRFLLQAGFLGKDGGNVAQAVGSHQAAAWRAEDKSKDTLAGSIQMRPKIEIDEFNLGNGFAFAIVQRAGNDRMDIIDLRAA